MITSASQFETAHFRLLLDNATTTTLRRVPSS
ncbi:Protein of unknown function [Pyronema omphalodes CBS 100304]|uniref:Uncharacterized protein n=1 Tax=Pyronema omphalodes (strain CBS 100304) TaxID=1076935 RepID=U4LFQ2_PYROM|nr:Protein of unknown function [Pyronema omphalodes CBS 100304]